MKVTYRIPSLLIGLALVIVACSSAGEEGSPTPQPEAVLTAAAQTAQAQLTELAKPQATFTPSSPPLNTLPPDTPTSIAGSLTSLPPGTDCYSNPNRHHRRHRSSRILVGCHCPGWYRISIQEQCLPKFGSCATLVQIRGRRDMAWHSLVERRCQGHQWFP